MRTKWGSARRCTCEMRIYILIVVMRGAFGQINDTWDFGDKSRLAVDGVPTAAMRTIPLRNDSHDVDCLEAVTGMRTSAGTLVLFAEGVRQGCGGTPVAILSRRKARGARWGAMSVVFRRPRDADASLGWASGGVRLGSVAETFSDTHVPVVVLLFTVGNFDLFAAYSYDDGVSFSKLDSLSHLTRWGELWLSVAPGRAATFTALNGGARLAATVQVSSAWLPDRGWISRCFLVAFENATHWTRIDEDAYWPSIALAFRPPDWCAEGRLISYANTTMSLVRARRVVPGMAGRTETSADGGRSWTENVETSAPASSMESRRAGDVLAAWHSRTPSSWAHWGGNPASPVTISYAPFRGGVAVDVTGILQEGATVVEGERGCSLLVYCVHEAGARGMSSTVAIQAVRDTSTRRESCSLETDGAESSAISEQRHLGHLQSRVKEERPMSYLESAYFRATLILILLAIALSICFNAMCGLSWWICCGERSKDGAPLRRRLAFIGRMVIFGLALTTFTWGFTMCITDMWDDFHRFRCYAAVVAILGAIARVAMFEQTLKCNGDATVDDRAVREGRRDEYI